MVHNQKTKEESLTNSNFKFICKTSGCSYRDKYGEDFESRARTTSERDLKRKLHHKACHKDRPYSTTNVESFLVRTTFSGDSVTVSDAESLNLIK